MTAEIIAVGTELLLGDILNTNAQFLSQQLAQLGITVHFQSVVGDNPARLESVVRLAMQRSDLLVFSGGLGPTDDDLTKQTVACAFEDELRFDEEELARIRAFFAAWGRTMPPNNEKQAYVPVRGRKLHNANGTAPGMLFEAKAGGKWAVLLPGPPAELQPMFLNEVKPWLAGLTDCALHSLVLRVAGIGESHLEGKVAHLLAGENPTAALYAKTGEVFIRITAKAQDAAAAGAMCRAFAGEFYAVLGDAIYGEDSETLAAAAVHALQKTGATAATAESCTGGLVSAALTDVPGASEVFGFGACTYSNEQKMRVLGVSAETLRQYGAVSAETAAEMAQGVRRAAGADFGIGITGIAGPGGGTKEKPVGLVFLAAACENKVYVQKLLMENRTRGTVRQFSAKYALEMLRRLALSLPQPGCEAFAPGTPAHLGGAQAPRDA